MIFSRNALSVASRMRLMPISSWLAIRVGWKLLKELRKHNRFSLLKLENHPFFPALNSPLQPLLPLH